ncbi:MAG: hypothetical protein ACJ8FT_00520 [Sphingomonas sp.]
MRAASKLLIMTASLAACHKAQSPVQNNQDMSVESNLAAGQFPPNAEIETLPPDESSETSSGELAKGDDNPDVNDVSNSH